MRTSTPVFDSPAKERVDKEGRGRPTSKTVPADPGTAGEPAGVRRMHWRAMLRKDKPAVTALILVLLLASSALFAPLLSPHTGDGDFAMRLQGPSLQHPFGTDDLGRDLFLRIMAGGRVSLAAGVSAMLFALLVGMCAGALAGYYGGAVDFLIMRVADLFLAVPVFFIILLLATLFSPGFLLICLLIAMTQWMEVSRVVRSVVLTVKESEFVEAARALGVSDKRILFRHVLSHTSGPIAVAATIGVAQAVMIESAISFLGFGVQPPMASWGSLLTHAQSYLAAAPWLAIFPGLMIFFTVLSCYALSDFLRASLGDTIR